MADLTPDRLAELRRIAAETTPGTYEWRIIETALALLDRIEALEADNNKLERENDELYRRIERLEAKLARQRVVLRRLQLAVERRNSQDRIEALRRKLSDEKRLLDRIEALERQLERAIDVAVNAALTMAVEDTGQMGLWALHDTAVQRAKERLEGGASDA